MNPVSILTDLLIIAMVALFAWLGWDDLRRLWRHATTARVEQILRDHAEAEFLLAEQQALALGGKCADPPCDDEDWWICDNHLPRGKHHPPPLRYGPEPIVGRCQWSERNGRKVRRMSVHDCPYCNCMTKQERERQKRAAELRERQEALVRNHAVLREDDLEQIREHLSSLRGAR